MKCIVLYNDIKDYRYKVISASKFDKNLSKCRNDPAVEYVLFQVGPNMMMPVHREHLPASFTPIKIRYTIGVRRCETFEIKESIMAPDLKNVVCIETLSEYTAFLYSLTKISAYNIIMNNSLYHPNNEFSGIAQDEKRYVVSLLNLSVYNRKDELIDSKDDIPIKDAIAFIGSVVRLSDKQCYVEFTRLKSLKFWIGTEKGQCSFSDYNNPRKMRGALNIASDNCLVSYECRDFDTYAFLGNSSEVNDCEVFQYMIRGKIAIIVYTMMCDEDDLCSSGPLSVDTLISQEDKVNIHRIETVTMYATSDIVELVSSASDLINTIMTVNKIIGDEYQDARVLLEFACDGEFYTDFTYTLTSEMLDDIEDPVKDFTEYVYEYTDYHVPF